MRRMGVVRKYWLEGFGFEVEGMRIRMTCTRVVRRVGVKG